MDDLELEGGSAYLMDFPLDGGFERFLRETTWSQTRQVLYGREVMTPRLTAWYGDPGCRYTYSSIRNEPLPWTALLIEVRDRLEELLSYRFNSVLLNLYRNGQDSIAFHADDERELGPQPVIASLSFGGSRRFTFRHKRRMHGDRHIDLDDGTLLLMMGDTQANWLHGVDKTREAEPRINLTFRRIEPQPTSK